MRKDHHYLASCGSYLTIFIVPLVYFSQDFFLIQATKPFTSLLKVLNGLCTQCWQLFCSFESEGWEEGRKGITDLLLFHLSFPVDLPSLSSHTHIMNLRKKPQNLPKILLLTPKWNINLICFTNSRQSILFYLRRQVLRVFLNLIFIVFALALSSGLHMYLLLNSFTQWMKLSC